ncbi:MAG: hypothetical protein LUK37_23390 [Clostridia bacterium]|nr:hypothetical protein [Clostridia bacterium]
MGIKGALKNIFGETRLSAMKGVVCHYGCKADMMFKHTPALNVTGNGVKAKYVLEADGYHVYRGYYDLNYLDDGRFLCHRLPVDAIDNRKTKCEIGFYDLEELIFHKVADTNAWCWQQGSRLRWHPTEKNRILFNSVDRDHYCTKIFDIDGNQTGIIDRPLYDITPDFKFGISLNCSRLQRMRPGYGYNYFDDVTKDARAPEDDGLFLTDHQKKESRLLYSLKNLAASIDPEGKYVHYLNHVSMAPDGEHFIFFHIYVDPNAKGWKTILYVSATQGQELKALEETDRVSHYCWMDNESLMVTCVSGTGETYYCTFKITNGEKKKINIDGLNTDGHPRRVCGTDFCVTDTYPFGKSRQKLMSFSLNDEKATTLACIYHDYRLRGEKRCDLHPSIADGGKLVSVDTTYQKKRRSIVIFERSI